MDKGKNSGNQQFENILYPVPEGNATDRTACDQRLKCHNPRRRNGGSSRLFRFGQKSAGTWNHGDFAI